MELERGISQTFTGRIIHPNELFSIYGKKIHLSVNPIVSKTLNEDEPEQFFLTPYTVGKIVQQTPNEYVIISEKIDYAKFDVMTNLYLLSYNIHNNAGIEYYFALPLSFYNVLVPGQIPMRSLSCMFKSKKSAEKYLAYTKLKYNISILLNMLTEKACAVGIRIPISDIKGE